VRESTSETSRRTRPSCAPTRAHEGKSDSLDAHRLAAETQADDRLSRVFKQSLSVSYGSGP
jgi:hypothetical protein